MTWILALIGVVFFTGAVAFVFQKTSLERIVLGAPLLAAALLILGLVYQARNASDGPYGGVRVVLRSLGFTPEIGGAVSVGGDAQTDDIVLSPGVGAAAWRVGRGKLPAHFLLIRRMSKDAVDLELQPQPGPGSRAVVAIGDKLEDAVYLGAVDAPDGAQMCTKDCDTTEPKLVEIKKGRVYSNGVFAFAAPGSQILRPAGGFVFTPTTDAQLMQAGASQRAAHYTVRAGQTARMTILEAVASPPRQIGVDPESSALLIHRSFRIAFDPRDGLTVTPDTPQTQVLDLDEGAAGRPVVRLGSGASAEEPPGVGEALAPFSLLGSGFDTDLRQIRLDVPRTSREPTVIHASDGSQQAVKNAFVLGGERRVEVQVQLLDFESGIYPWVWIWGTMALACGVFASRALRLEDPLAAMTLGVVEVLLTMRLLIAVEGAFVDASAKAQQAVEAALIALPLGVMVTFCAHPRSPEFRFGVVCLAVFTLSTTVLAWATTGTKIDLLFVAPILTAACVLWVWAPQSWREALAAFVVGRRDDLGRLSKRIDQVIKAPSQAPLVVGIGGGLVLLGLRALFLLAGVKESVSLGGTRVALSLLFTPLTLVFAAPLLASAHNGWTGKWEAHRAAAGLLALLALGVGAASFAVKDNGFMIIGIAVIIGATTAYYGRSATSGWAIDLAAAAAPAALALTWLMCWAMGVFGSLFLALAMGATGLLALVIWFTPSAGGSLKFGIGRPGGGWLAPAVGAAGLLTVVNLVAAIGPLDSPAIDLDQALRADTNTLRLFAVLAPDRLQQFGTRGAGALHDTVEHMRVYGQTFLGRGYFTLPEPTVLKPYHLTDNLSAVHLISPFGRLGAFALMLAPVSLAIAACAKALATIPEKRTGAWLGALAALTLASVSVYMVLANLLAAPFTGRNVYLLASTSTADLIEGLTLAALTLLMLGDRSVVKS